MCNIMLYVDYIAIKRNMHFQKTKTNKQKTYRAGFVNLLGLISHKVENLPCSCPGKRPPPRVEEEFKFSHLHSLPVQSLRADNRDL